MPTHSNKRPLMSPIISNKYPLVKVPPLLPLNSFYCHLIFNFSVLTTVESARVKENSFISVKSLPVNSISMCLQSSLCAFSLLLIFFSYCHAIGKCCKLPWNNKTFLYSSFKGKCNKHPPRLSTFLRISAHPFS